MWTEFFILIITLLGAYVYFAKQHLNRQRAVVTSKEEKIQRNILCHDKLLKVPNNQITTLYELFCESTEKYQHRNLFGIRDILDTKVEEKTITVVENDKEVKKTQKLFFPKLSPYKWSTYKEVRETVIDLSKSLQEKFKFDAQTPVLLFAETQPLWLKVAHACWAQSWIVVTAYANLGNEGLEHCFGSCDTPLVFTTSDKLELISQISKKCPNIKHIIVLDELDEKKKLIEDSNIEIQSLSEIQKKSGEKINPPKPEDLAVLMFTSGSTGLPKAVMISHSNIICAISGLSFPIPLLATDVYIAYLPLAHVLELIVENILIYKGASLGYGSPRTLTDLGVHNCKGDITELRPTLMAGVPAVWEKIRKGANDKVAELSPNFQKIFKYAFQLKKFLLDNGLPTFFLDKTIFKKTSEATGGRLRLIISGGAPISSESQEFLRTCLCAPCLQGYGLTETCGAGCVTAEDFLKTKNVGTPVPCCEIKLIDVPELKYFRNEDKGEILIRGGNVTKGYWKNEEKTKAEFDKDGWFHTGDIGQWHPDGTLSIIDRVKNITKLSHGEYIALESLESTYSTSQFVEQLNIYADGDRDSCIAIVVPRKKTIESWAKENSISFNNFEELCKNKKAKYEVLSSFQAIGKEKKKTKVEIPTNVILCHEEWTPENLLLTAAMKLNRSEIKKRFENSINEAYKN